MAGVIWDIRNQNDDLSTKKVEAYEESGEFPPDVEFVELETDVGWYYYTIAIFVWATN